MQKSNLYIRKITVDGGPSLKRWQPRAFGRASPIRKRSSHITIVLGERVESKRKEDQKTEALEKPKTVETIKAYAEEVAREEKRKEEQTPKAEPRKEIKKQSKGFLKRILQRRTGGK